MVCRPAPPGPAVLGLAGEASGANPPLMLADVPAIEDAPPGRAEGEDVGALWPNAEKEEVAGPASEAQMELSGGLKFRPLFPF